MTEREAGADEDASLAEAGDPPLLQPAGQSHEHVAGGLRIGEGAMAGGHRGAKGVGDGTQAVVRKPGRQKPGQGESVDGAFTQTSPLEALEFVVQEPHVEGRVVGHDHRAPKELEEVGHDLLDAGRVGHHLLGYPRNVRDHRRYRPLGIDQGVKAAHLLEAFKCGPRRSR